MTNVISPERPDTQDAIELISELEAHLDPLYPKTSRHGYSVEKLMKQSVAFFVTRYDEAAAGCGGIELFGKEFGEVKRMYVRPQYRGLGLAKSMLDHLTAYALGHDIRLLRLETGIYQKEAIALYERVGFQRIGPFGEYREDPLSRFYEKRIG
jgi:putative acetyltransferase